MAAVTSQTLGIIITTTSVTVQEQVISLLRSTEYGDTAAPAAIFLV